MPFEVDINQFNFILNYESSSSLIDRYLTLKKIIQVLLTYEKFTVVAEEKLVILKKYIQDRDLYYAENNNFKSYLNLIDDFLKGNFEEVVDGAQTHLKLNPSDLLIIDLYIKSLISLNRKYNPIIKNDSILNKISEYLYNIYTKNDKTNKSIESILKLSYQLSSFDVGLGLYFLFYQCYSFKLPNQRELLRFVYNKNLPLLFNYSILKHKILEGYTKILNDQNGIFNDIICDIINGKKENQFKVIDGVCYSIKLLISGEFQIFIDEYDEAIKFYEILINEYKENEWLYEEAIIALFYCYYKKNEYNKCINIYVSNYFKNSNFVNRFFLGEIHNKIEKSRFKVVEHNIELVIFYHLTKHDNHYTYFAYEYFLKNISVTKPSEINPNIKLTHDYLVYFLDNICTQEILKYSTLFGSTKDILNERIKVYQILLSNDSSNESKYINEINKITQNLAILEGIQQVDQSKIYVDEKGLITNDLKDFEDSFNRYLQISSLIEENSLLILDLNSSAVKVLKIKDRIDKNSDEPTATTDMKFELFRNLFDEVRDKFLFSNRHGLDSYLSTRIRHGTLLGQLRVQFQDQNLITLRDKKDEKYMINSYWENKLTHLIKNKKEKLQAYLAVFSKDIDLLINSIKEEYIQISTEKRINHGLFQFDFSNIELAILFKAKYAKIKRFNDFIELVLGDLWTRTELNLEIVRNFITRDIGTQINAKLNELEKNIKSILDTSESQEFMTRIANCRTNVQVEISKISEWFKRREMSINDFKIEKVINTGLEITNKISKTVFNLNKVDKNIKSMTILKGEYFIHLFDLIRIFLDNIVNNARLSSEELKINIVITEDENFLNITIINNLTSSTNINSLEEIINSIKTKLRATSDFEITKKEGGSGFFKAMKILKYDLQNQANQFDFFINSRKEFEVSIKLNINTVKR